MPTWKIYPHRRTGILQVEGYNGKLPSGAKDRATWTTGVDVDAVKWAASPAYRKRVEADPDVAALMASLAAKWPVYAQQVAAPTMQGYKAWTDVGAPVQAANLTIVQLCDAWIAGKRPDWEPQTLRKAEELRRILAAYSPDATAHQVDLRWHDGFAAYLRTPHGRDQAVATQAGIAKRTEKVKELLAWTRGRKLHQATDWQLLPTRKPPQEPGYYLTDAERDALAGLLPTCSPGEARTLHGFLLACYTGMRHSDVRLLAAGQVHQGWLEYVAVKTRKVRPKPIRLPVLPHFEAHLGHVLQHGVQALSLCNSNLKALARRAGLTRATPDGPVCETLAFHTARRTFIAGCLRRGMELSVITRLVGHSTIRQLMAYKDVLDGEVDAAMREAWVSPKVSPDAQKSPEKAGLV